MRVIGVIPARYASTRFPGKPLALIKGRTLIERVWRQARMSRELDDVIVATDDRRIVAAVTAFGGRAVLTSRACTSGTDRMAEVAGRVEKKADIFINIQGDEPLISPLLIDRLVLTLRQNPAVMAVTAVYPMNVPEERQDPNVVKVVTDRQGFALYFSRYPVPFARSAAMVRLFKHLGIYGYRRDFLIRFASWKQTPLEKAECLEQLRILEMGYRVKTIVARRDSFGVDVPGDVVKIERLIK
jgi:3-deoxy-manno-octulosonate cytidylyltransferase (CMP-KDO synthetase)